MLEFKTNKGSIKIKGNLNLQMKSPLFNTDQLKGTFSFPFTHPLFTSEKSILKNPGRITSVNNNETLTADLFKDGINILSGDFTIQKADEHYASSYFKGGVSRFSKYFADTYLDQVNFGEKHFDNDAEMITYFNDTATGWSSYFPFKLPYLRAHEVVEIDDDGLNEIYAKPNTINYLDDDGSYQMDDGAGKKYMLCPSLYLNFVLEILFESVGYQFIDKALSGFDLSSLIIVGMTNITDLYMKNWWNLNIFLPHITVSSFIFDIQNLLGLAFIFDDKHNTVRLQAVNDIIQQLKPALIVNHGPVIINKSESISGIKFQISFNDKVIKSITDSIIYETLDSELPAPEDNKYKTAHTYWNDVYLLSIPGPNSTWIWEPITDYEKISTERTKGEEKYLTIKTNAAFLHNALESHFCTIGTSINDTKNMKPTLIFTDIKTAIIRDNILMFVVKNFYYNATAVYFRDLGFETIYNNWFNFLKSAKPIETLITLTNRQLSDWDWLQPIQIENTLVLPNLLEPTLSESGEIKAILKAYTL